MEQNNNSLKANAGTIFLALPILMAVIFAFCPIADVFGKATFNGLKLAFGSKGYGFGSFCAFMSLLLPIAAIIFRFVTVKLPDKIEARFNTIWAAASIIFILLLTVTFPNGISLAWGGYIYILLAIACIVGDYKLK